MSSTSENAAPRSSPPDAGALRASLERLRAEHDRATSSVTQALLLHEMGVLAERFGDEASAARDHLAAVNSDADFREPLERLVAIIERRQSYKNLGKVLERLVRVSDAPAERSKALVDQAAFLVDHEIDLDGARVALLEAAEQTPEDPSVWLALELVAARLSDLSLAERALAARAELIQTPTLRALLLVDLAELRAETGNIEAAFDVLDRAVAHGGEATFLALLAQERLAHEHDQPEAEARALETQGELLLRAIGDAKTGDAHGIPHYRRTRAEVAEAWLRAAEIHRRRGENARAAALLDRTLAEASDEPLILHLRMLLAEAIGDNQTVSLLARRQIESGIDGEAGASLWLRIAEAASADGERSRALEAAEKAIALAPKSVPARALELDLRAQLSEPSRLATSLESVAEEFELDSTKASFYLLSADVWARLANDVSGAKAALSQASMFGAAPSLVARVARMLAALIGDNAWYEEATRRLLAQGATEEEQAELWLELARSRAQRGDAAGATLALRSSASTSGGAWLGHALGAYLTPLLSAVSRDSGAPQTSDAKPWKSLAALSELETDPEAARSLRIVAALRALLQQDVDAALEQLDALHGEDPKDLVVTGAFVLLLTERKDFARARDALARSAAETSDTEMATALGLAAGILSFRSGERTRAIDAFQRAAEDGPEAATNILGWALCAAEPNDLGARAKALDALAESDPALAQLERFALEVGRGGSQDVAWEALRGLGESDDAALKHAGELARALWSPTSNGSRVEALDALAQRGKAQAQLFRAVSHQLELGLPGTAAVPDTARALETAERWASSDRSLAAAFEWLAFAIATGDQRRELDAREALAERLPAPAAHALAASAILVSGLTGESLREKPANGVDHPALHLANLELAAPGQDPGLRARALLDARPALGDECVPIVTALAGFNQLAAGDIEGALASFRSVVEVYPSEVIGWEGLRAAALAQGDRSTLAEACAALGDAIGDGGVGARLWEEAATILIDELSDPMRGEFALSRAIDRDITCFSAFDRLFRMVRARRDGAKLLDLIERRLQVTDDAQEIVRLIWERARTLREAGDREGALGALEQVRELEPDHVGALALTGEICITLQRFDEAAENLARLSQHPEAPAQQRLMSGVAAVDLYENRLRDVPAALAVLEGLYRSGLSTLPVRERLARTASKAQAWEQATEVLEQLMSERDSKAGRLEAARLATAIYRDELKMPEAAENALTRLLEESPSDGEGLDMLLTNVFSRSLSERLLQHGLDVLVASLTENPTNAEAVDRVSRIAERLGRLPLRQAALGALVALGADARGIDPELARLDERVARMPRIAIDDASLPDLADPEDGGPIAELMSALAPTIAEELGPALSAFGVGKRERIDPRSGLALRNEIAAWAGALGLGEFELYVGGNDASGVNAVVGEIPALVVGKDVTAPLAPRYRQAVARELLALRRGTSVLRHREPDEIHALVVAACSLADVALPSPAFAMLGEFQRQLGRAPRKVRKLLPELARAVEASGADPKQWYRAATSTLDRMAVIAAGDVSWVLTQDPKQRGLALSTQEGTQRARRLLSFVLSPTYLAIRDKLGMGIR